MKIILNPKFQHLSNFLEHLEEHFPEGQLVQDSFNEIRLLQADGLTLSVKRYGHSFKRRLKFYKTAKGKRAFISQRYLRERGYDSPEPVAFVRYRKNMVTQSTYLVTVRSQPRHDLTQLASFSEDEQQEIIHALAAYTVRLHEDGFIHHNFKAKHVLFDKNENGSWSFALIDVNRVHRHHHSVRTERGLKNFERLILPEGLLEQLVREYARLRHYDEDQAWNYVQVAHQAYQDKVRKRGR